MRARLRWGLGAAVAAAVVGVPAAYYRADYAHSKRLREVTPGRFYRSGQLTAAGFREAVHRFGLRSVVNLQEEAQDPLIPETWQGRPAVRESTVCRALGVRYLPLDGGVLDQPGHDTGDRPKVLDDFLALLDDPGNYPMLIHCKAGLHRTGLMTAVYRMDIEHRSRAAAVRELRANGFGTFAATDSNDYMKRFVRDFTPGTRRPPAAAGAAARPAPANPGGG